MGRVEVVGVRARSCETAIGEACRACRLAQQVLVVSSHAGAEAEALELPEIALIDASRTLAQQVRGEARASPACAPRATLTTSSSLLSFSEVVDQGMWNPRGGDVRHVDARRIPPRRRGVPPRRGLRPSPPSGCLVAIALVLHRALPPGPDRPLVGSRVRQTRTLVELAIRDEAVAAGAAELYLTVRYRRSIILTMRSTRLTMRSTRSWRR